MEVEVEVEVEVWGPGQLVHETQLLAAAHVAQVA